MTQTAGDINSITSNEIALSPIIAINRQNSIPTRHGTGDNKCLLSCFLSFSIMKTKTPQTVLKWQSILSR